ncbi:MAG: hypothetical protein ACXIU8_00415 [Alkalilacustris sp.]
MGGATRVSGALRGVIAAAAVLVGAIPAQAGPPQGDRLASVHAPQVVQIRNHRGGFLPHVVDEMQALRRSGAQVRIDGGFCFSACTVFLAVESACVAPWTRFGFHAPSDPRSGRTLTGPAFEQATAHVARYYRPALARWWMAQGRHTRQGLAMLTGADLIAMGYAACAPRPGDTG